MKRFQHLGCSAVMRIMTALFPLQSEEPLGSSVFPSPAACWGITGANFLYVEQWSPSSPRGISFQPQPPTHSQLSDWNVRLQQPLDLQLYWADINKIKSGPSSRIFPTWGEAGMIAMFKKRKKNHLSWKMKALSHLWEKSGVILLSRIYWIYSEYSCGEQGR